MLHKMFELVVAASLSAMVIGIKVKNKTTIHEKFEKSKKIKKK